MEHHPDHKPYIHFTGRQRVDTAVHTLAGILKGIAIDRKLLPAEIKELNCWVDEQLPLIQQHPFTELIPVVTTALEDGHLSSEEHADLLWLCDKFSPASSYYDDITNSIQTLHGVLHGILADGIIHEEEARRLSVWLGAVEHLSGTYPYDEINSLLLVALRDGTLDPQEQARLRIFFESFMSYSMDGRIKRHREKSAISEPTTIAGVCAATPRLEFADRLYCFTGASLKAPRKALASHVVARGGLVAPRVTPELNYLVIGGAGNPCWAYACYGRKVEAAVLLRRQGHKIVIVHEHDFWDAIDDCD